jgi:glycosyltransferase involved in cell wall biosynthesis
MREYYDLWPYWRAELGVKGQIKEHVRRTTIRAADRYLLTRNVTRLFVQSRTIQDRLSMWPSLRSTVLYPPAPGRAYRTDDYGAEFLFVSRLTPLKRADLAIGALAEPDAADARLVVAGEGDDRANLERYAASLGVEARVTFAGRLSDDEMLGRLARCRAVVFPPLYEDYGFVTVEAFASRKAVITCRDSGGPAELVDDGVSGFVCEPTPAAIASAMWRLGNEPGLAERMGAAAFHAGANLNWPDTVGTLVLQ